MDDRPTAIIGLPSPRMAFLIALGFFACMLTVYGASLSNTFVLWDDTYLIYFNPLIKELSLANLRAYFTSFDPELYVPLTMLSYAVDYAIAGLNPFVFHLHNLILHTLNALLIALVLYLLGLPKQAVLLCGLLFAVHPLHTEAVVWASARKDVLSTFFFLGSLSAYLVYRNRGNDRWYWTSLSAFLLGLLAKVMILTLPMVLLLVDWRSGRPWSWQIIVEKLPYFLLSIIFGTVAILGKQEVLESTAPFQTVLMATKSTLFYLEKFFLPLDLSVMYPFNGMITVTSLAFLVPLLLCLALAFLMFLSLRWTRHVFVGLGNI